MDQKQKSLYTLMMKMALTYRLSLNNICILLGKEPTNENKKEVYDIFELLFGNNINLRNCYLFLFNYETYKEPEKISNVALISAYMFLKKYKKASRNHDKEEMRKLISELNDLDNKVKPLKLRDTSKRLLKQDYFNVVDYRIKYSLSVNAVCNILKIKRDTLRDFEKRITNPRLRYKIDKLADYYLDIKTEKFIKKM